MINKHITLSLLAVFMALGASAAGKYKTMYEIMGWDAALWQPNLEIRVENYPSCGFYDTLDRIKAYPAKVDTLLFSPFLGFGMTCCNPKTVPSSDPFTAQPIGGAAGQMNFSGKRNALPQLWAAGTDPLKETIKWCRSNKVEIMVSLPLNFQMYHMRPPDQDNPPTSWQTYFWPPFKAKNTTALLNGGNMKDAGSFWTGLACDFGQEIVRNKYLAICKEISENYDVDGLMVDFMLIQPAIFASVYKGGVANAKETALITTLLTTVKGYATAASQRLGHPVKFGICVPDSVGYCKDIGIDLTALLDAKIPEFVVYGGRFQLNPWKVTGDFMAKYPSVPFYPSFSYTWIQDPDDTGWERDDEQLPRIQDPACFQARMADAIKAGASGCMYAAIGHWETEYWPERSVVRFDPEQNRYADKLYFVSYSNLSLANWAYPEGMKHATFEDLCGASGQSKSLEKGALKYHINVIDDFAKLKAEGKTPVVTLLTQMAIPSGVTPTTMLNGQELKPFKKCAGTQYYKVPLTVIKTGLNEIMVKTKGANRRHITPTLGNLAIKVEFPAAGKEAGK